MTQLVIEWRAATQLDVSFPKRQIELVVMPYETEAQVVHKGRLIREIVSRGAFEGLDASHRRIMVNRGHVIDHVVGKAIQFHPSRQDGLVAELQIAKTADGDETLQLADEGLLDASAGFGVPDGGETWPERGLRRLGRLWLDHIAMTPDPAYPTANVLAVRDTAEPDPDPADRPNLDVVRGWRLSDRYAMIGVVHQETNAR
jgi:HK97 family phage prohead protease